MNLDPKVFECIKKYRRRAALDRIKLVTPFGLAFVFSVTLLVVTVLFGRSLVDYFKITRSEEAVYWWGQTSLFLKLAAIVVGLPLFLFLGYQVVRAVLYARDRFGSVTSQQTLDYDRAGFRKFEEALDGAGIASGVPSPNLVVLDDPAPNALAFIDSSGRKGVAVTRGLLEAGIPVDEADAIMAHELSHLMIGENIKPPRWRDIEFMPSSMLVLFGFVSMTAIVLAPGETFYMLLALMAAISILVLLILVQRSESFMLELLDLGYQHTDMLADSIAASIIRDPVALENAIKKIDSLSHVINRVPGGSILARYLFVTTPTLSGDYYRYTTQVAGEILTARRPARTWLVFNRRASKACLKLLELESRETRERLVNLDLIKQGHWRAFEEWS